MESFQLACRLYWCSDIFTLNMFMSLFLTRTVLLIQVQSVSISTGAHLNSHIGWVKLTNTLLLTHIVHRTVSIWINWNNYQVRRLWTFSRVSISTHQYMFSCQVAVWSHQNSCSWILPQCWYISAHNCLTCDYTHWHLKVHKDCKHMYQICWFSCICACSVVVVVVVVVVGVCVCVCVYCVCACIPLMCMCACVYACVTAVYTSIQSCTYHLGNVYYLLTQIPCYNHMWMIPQYWHTLADSYVFHLCTHRYLRN